MVQHVPPNGPEEFTGISVDGNPADCVKLAVRTLLAHRPQLVCTGINAGANVGINVFYSGTVAAAAEAAMLGLPAVAFSADTSGGEVNYARAAALCRRVLDRLLDTGLQDGELINVNVPVLGEGQPPVRVAPQSRVEIEDTYEAVTDENGRKGYHLGSEYAFVEHGEGTDVALLAAGCVTVTPLRVDMTDHARLDALHALEADGPAQR
jgi:5'-nucleotidase